MIRDAIVLASMAAVVYLGAAIAIWRARTARKEVERATDIGAARQRYLEGKIDLPAYEEAVRRAEHLHR